MAVLEELNRFLLPKIKKYSKALKRTMFLAIYPKRCPLCDKVLPSNMSICISCEEKLPRIHEPVCYRCGKSISSAEQEFCYDCRSFPKSFQSGISLFLYNEVTRPIMADFKYHNKRILSEFIIEELLKSHQSTLEKWKPQLIIPIPVHTNKYKKRGYNQAELLAKELSAQLNIPYISNLLLRTVDTLPQKYFTAESRFHNLSHAFSANPDYNLTGIDSVLLIDDIYTTGATMEACTKVLLNSGIKHVFICSICSGVARE